MALDDEATEGVTTEAVTRLPQDAAISRQVCGGGRLERGEDPADAKALLVQVQANLRLQQYEQAFRDATLAVETVRAFKPGAPVSASWLASLADGVHLQGVSALASGDVHGACRALRAATKLMPHDADTCEQFCRAVEQLPLNLVAQILAHYIVLAGRKPTFALSQRDGSILKPLPEGCGMAKPALAQHLQDAFSGREQRARKALQSIWSTSGTAPSASTRHLIYSLRSITLMRAQNVDFALKDACAALAFMPEFGDVLTLETHSQAALLAATRMDGATVQMPGVEFSVPALAAAAISMHRATRLDDACDEALQRILPRLNATHAHILEFEGCDALVQRLRDEASARLPLYMQPVTKYHFYFQWMSERIAEKFPQLEGEQTDKLLLMDASQLDMLLDNKEADAALLLQAAEHGIAYETFQRLASSSKAPGLLAQ